MTTTAAMGIANIVAHHGKKLTLGRTGLFRHSPMVIELCVERVELVLHHVADAHQSLTLTKQLTIFFDEPLRNDRATEEQRRRQRPAVPQHCARFVARFPKMLWSSIIGVTRELHGMYSSKRAYGHNVAVDSSVMFRKRTI